MSARPSLGAFLRSRRERVSPGDVGLPAAGRRRTPGLRREEVAILAGISADYLVRLEQNRERRPSVAVLTALSAVLGLDGAERVHAFRLATVDAHRDLCPNAGHDEPVKASTVALLDQLGTVPALVLDRSTDIVARNRAGEALLRSTGVLAGEGANVARYMFSAPEARTVYLDWMTAARALVADLHAAAACARDDALDALVGELLVTSPEFATLWARHEVSTTRRGPVIVSVPEMGRLAFDVEALLLPGCSGRRFVSFVPADQSTAAACERLAGEPTVALPMVR